MRATTSDGVALAIDKIAAQGSPRATIVCLHAMMADGRYFGARHPDGFAANLAARGVDVYVASFRGHGDSGALADWSFDDLVELDLPAIVAAVCADATIAPAELAILGHSLGGLVATAAIGTGRIAAPRALILAAACVWMTGPTGSVVRRAIMRAFPFVARREAPTYKRQLAGWSRAMQWTSLRGVDYGAARGAIACPTYPFAGVGDWMCTPRDAEQFAGHIPSATPVMGIGKRHGDPVDPDHFGLIRADLPRLREWIVDVATR